MKIKYPYQNLKLKNIKGESWKDIPGLAGYFMVSNLGRIRRLEYSMQYRNGAIYTKPERIIRPNIVKAPNKFKKDFTYFLIARVILHGKRYDFTIARLVYDVFIRSIGTRDKEKVVLTRDYDNFNIRPSNLHIVDLSFKQQRIFERERSVSPFKNLSESAKKKQRMANYKKQIKKVTQYSLEGHKRKTFPSIIHASKSTKIHVASISSAARGKTITAGRFAWAFGEEKFVNIQEIRKRRKIIHQKKYGFKVSQYDFTGNKIAQFPSLQDAQERTGINAGQILLVIKRVYKSAKGYFWKSGYGKNKIDLSRHSYGRASTALTQSKEVKQFSLEGKYINTFASVKKAAKHIQLSPSTLSDALNGKQKTSGGYIWKFS